MFALIFSELTPAQHRIATNMLNRGIITQIDNSDDSSSVLHLYDAQCQLTHILSEQIEIEIDMLQDDLDANDPDSLRNLADVIEMSRTIKRIITEPIRA